MFRKLYESGGSRVKVTVDGVEVEAEAGEPVAAVLLRTEPYHARIHPVSGRPRAPYCMMGVCFDCLAVIDAAESTQTCLTAVRDGMTIERQRGARSVPDVPQV
ncbi:MAG: (2Fe-2S)-binding protein [Betaproteobacteria bacterium RIFCSPLOWO2_12_FULL_62_13]|nr:MAG: (2Fe-2S)-binding protein [Betaproteobacteria bacterium RIFCSPLOWO2_12_FULL_62_13]